MTPRMAAIARRVAAGSQAVCIGPPENCSAVAIKALTGEKVEGKKRTPSEITLVMDKLGYHYKVDSLTRKWMDKPARSFDEKTRFTGMLFVSGHVMPVVRGRMSNFCGHGDEPITFLMSFTKRRK